ncbi:unnamed protein product [Urochloa humidicola]
MMALTLLSLLALLLGGVHLYVGLGFVTASMSVAGGVRWCLRRYRGSGDEVEDDEEQTKKLDAASKVTASATYSAFGGIVGVLFNASKVSSQAVGAVDAAAYAAIFFMFATAILGMLVTTVSKKVPEITNPACRRVFDTGVRLANAFLLCTLACAALAASYTVLRLRVLAAFLPLAATAAISILLRHCVAARRRGHTAAAAAAGREDREEARVRAMEDVASKVMVATLGGVMSVLGGWLGEKEHARWGAMDVFMVVLTSAFVSSFGFTVLAAAPGSARERLAPVARALIWSHGGAVCGHGHCRLRYGGVDHMMKPRMSC